MSKTELIDVVGARHWFIQNSKWNNKVLVLIKQNSFTVWNGIIFWKKANNTLSAAANLLWEHKVKWTYFSGKLSDNNEKQHLLQVLNSYKYIVLHVKELWKRKMCHERGVIRSRNFSCLCHYKYCMPKWVQIMYNEHMKGSIINSLKDFTNIL